MMRMKPLAACQYLMTFDKPTDTPDKIDYKKTEAIARLVFEIARELGERNLPWK